MRLTQRMIYAMAISALTLALTVTTVVRARADRGPAPEDVAFAPSGRCSEVITIGPPGVSRTGRWSSP